MDQINHSPTIRTEEYAWEIKGASLFSMDELFSLRTPVSVKAGGQTGHVDVLDSLDSTRDSQGATARRSLLKGLSIILEKLVPATNIKVEKLPIKFPTVPKLTNASDCGIFVIEYMRSWDSGCLKTKLTGGSSALYRIKHTSWMMLDLRNHVRNDLLLRIRKLAPLNVTKEKKDGKD